MCEYEDVELYPYIKPESQSEYGHFVAEYDEWKYTFEVQDRSVVLIEITRPWQVGDRTPPDWVPTAAEERVTVSRTSRTDIPATVITALLMNGVLGHQHQLTVRAGE